MSKQENKPNILVTGANGQLGKTFFEHQSKWPDYNYVFKNRKELDITDRKSVDVVFSIIKPKYLINCAAYTAVDKAESEEELAYQVNSMALEILSDACKKYNVNLIHFSSDYIYHPLIEEDTPMNELYPCLPNGVYAKSKFEGERKIFKAQINAVILRTSWVYSQFSGNFVHTMLSLSKTRDSLNIVNDQIGAPTHTIDIVDATIKIIKSIDTNKFDLNCDEVYNYAGEGKISWYDFAKAIFTLKNIDIELFPIPSSGYPTPAQRPKWSVLDMTKIKKDFGIAPVWWKERLKESLD